MLLANLAVVITTSFVLVQCHDCKDYDLSASDQSLIDMMKHYLHTSRKEQVYSTGKPGASGQVGGNHYTNKGGGVNYLCLPNDPENGESINGGNVQLFGAEYQIDSSYGPSEMKSDMVQKEVPCTVCYQRKRSNVLMIPGRKTCYKGWTFEYTGYLMSDYKEYSYKDYVCVDKDAEPVDNKTSDENGALFYGISTSCGSLRCPPYKNGVSVKCVVCTK